MRLCYIGDDKADLIGDPDNGTLLLVDKYGECLPQYSKVRIAPLSHPSL